MRMHRRGTGAALVLALTAMLGVVACDSGAQGTAHAAAPPPAALAPPPPPSTASREVGPLPSLAPLVESVKAAVVNVDVTAGIRNARLGTDADPLERFFGSPERRSPVRGKGSGFIIDPQ
ncbi:MAG TPA: peptidase S1, partial [Myxococcaceae bacterium]|nr:peptidase S1 [Myxococcaceae bacterium]